MAKYGLGLSISDGQTLTIAEGMALPITDPGGTPTPVQPSGLSLAASGSTAVTLTFNGGMSDTYTVEYRAGTGSWLTHATAVTTPTGNTTITIPNLTPSTAYTARVANNATPTTYVTSSTVTTDASTPEPGTGCLWTPETVAQLLADVATLKTDNAAIKSDVAAIVTSLAGLVAEIVEKMWTRSSRTITGQTAAAGFAKSTEITAAMEAILAHGNEAWLTATGFAVAGAQMTLTTDTITAIRDNLAKSSEVNAARDAILNRGNTYWVTATDYATPADVTLAINQIIAHGDTAWLTGSGSGGNAPTAAQNAAAVWQYTADTGRTLSAAFPTVPSAADNAQAVWDYSTGDGRTMTLTTQQLAAIGAAVLATPISDTTPGARLTLDALIRGSLSWTADGTTGIKTLKADATTVVQTYTVKRDANGLIIEVK